MSDIEGGSAERRRGSKGFARGLIPDWLDELFLRSLVPVIRRFVAAGVNPNWLTVLAFLLTVVGALLIIADELIVAAIAIIVGGILDFTDGKVAALTGRITKFGAILDSTLDRFSDVAIYLALVLYFAARSHSVTAYAVVLALVGSTLTSYLMALGRSHGYEFRVGVLRRQDRVTLISAGLLFTFAHTPLEGLITRVADQFALTLQPLPIMPLALAVYVLAVLSNVTALQRFLQLLKLSRAPRDAGPGGHLVSTPEGEPTLRDRQLNVLRETIEPSPLKRMDGNSRRAPYLELIRNFAIDVVSVRVKSRRFRPLMTNFYVTKRCNLRCRYCYPPGHEPELPVDQALELLERIRPRNPALNITGGEPLLYSGINQVIRRASELRFQPILLSTNGLLVDRVVEALHLVDHLIISLDSLEREVNEQLTGVPGSTERIVSAIERCAELASEKRFQLSLHTVITPETIPGIEDVLRFCESVGASLSLSPEHGRFDPNPDLLSNQEYVALIDRLLEFKRRGKPVFCSRGYLRAIRDFAPHRCFPFVSPRVEPDGRVYFPCQRIASRHVYLQDFDSLDELMRQEVDWNAAPACARRCFLACYVEVEQYLKNPLAAVAELSIRRAITGRARPSRALASRP